MFDLHLFRSHYSKTLLENKALYDGHKHHMTKHQAIAIDYPGT